MGVILYLVLGSYLGPFTAADREPSPEDSARLREMLYDRQQPRNQSQAALLLLQTRSLEAEDIVRRGLRETDLPEVFLALAAALRLQPDSRFLPELLAALAGDQPALRQAAAESLAGLVDAAVVRRLQALAEDSRASIEARCAALSTLGRAGSKAATTVLLDQLSSDIESIRQAAAEALSELTGRSYGTDLAPWRDWWQRHKDLSNERWLEERLKYQTSRSRRLEGDLQRTKSQVVRLNQQLYARLPAADRLAHVQTLVDQEDSALRVLAVDWSLELLSAADALGQRTLADVLLRLSRDGSVEVQRAAVLALGKVNDSRVFDRLLVLLKRGPVPVRAAAARSLAQQARGTGAEAETRRRQVVPALQKALDDPALEVVVEAAEDLGSLGVPEAAPVLAALLRHPSESVRQTAALALERVADASVLDGLLAVLDDPAVAVRFSLVGALGRAAGDGRSLKETQRANVLARLETLLLRDADPGVRSRAATVLGECGSPSVLPLLWRRVLAAEDRRVQDKAWAAVVEIIARSGSLELLREWDRTLTEAKQGPRRLHLLGETWQRWRKREDAGAAVGAALEMLVPAQLEQGKWAAAFPLVRELLARPGSDADIERRLRWLLTVGEQALKEGNRAEALRVVQHAQALLARHKNLAEAFSQLEKQAGQ